MTTAKTPTDNTPQNTPIPGGGRWRWDIALPGWVEVLEDQPATPTPTQE